MSMSRKKDLWDRVPGGTRERSVVVVDALIRMGVPLGSVVHYKSIAASLGMKPRAVRNLHEAWWPLCERMMEVERQNVMMKAERDKFLGMASPPEDPVGTGEIDMLEFLSRPKMPTEAQNFDKALETLQMCMDAGIAAKFTMPARKRRKTA